MGFVILVKGTMKMKDKTIMISEAKKIIYDLRYTNDTYNDNQIANMIECLCNELENVESKLSELLNYTTGGRLSETKYDIGYMKEVVDDYRQDMCVEGCNNINALLQSLERTEHERDVAIKDLAGDCSVCKHLSYCSLHPCYCINGNVWEWRGVPNKNNA
jgi:hypothetical protein